MKLFLDKRLSNFSLIQRKRWIIVIIIIFEKLDEILRITVLWTTTKKKWMKCIFSSVWIKEQSQFLPLLRKYFERKKLGTSWNKDEWTDSFEFLFFSPETTGSNNSHENSSSLVSFVVPLFWFVFFFFVFLLLSFLFLIFFLFLFFFERV